MVSYIDKVKQLLTKLKSFAEGPETLQDRNKLVKQLKIDMTAFDNIPPCLEVDPKEAILAREIYEYATFLSVEKKDIEEFERNISVLKSYYDEFANIIPPSEKKNAVTGLYLLYLLSYNKISQYHTEIEMIPHEDLDNIFIKVPVNLETYFV